MDKQGQERLMELCNRFAQVERELVRMREEVGVSIEDLAELANTSASHMWAVEDHSARETVMDCLPEYCAALGKTFTLTITDADDEK